MFSTIKCPLIVIFQLKTKRLLGSIIVSLRDFGTLAIDEVKTKPSLTLLCSDVELSKPVEVYKCVTSNCSTLIHLGNFVKYSDGESSMV